MQAKFKTKYLILASIIAVLFFGFAANVSAATGTCGKNLKYDLSNDTLTISGTGDMTNWSSGQSQPWYGYREYIKTIIIEEGVTSIGDYAFYDCGDLTSITIPNSITSIGKYAFCECYGLTSIIISNSVTSIDEYAFYGCTGLTSITIPKSVTSIGDCAFYRCTGLTKINVSDKNEHYSSFDGNVYNKDHTSILIFAPGKTSITIPNSVTSIGDYAFYDCTGLTSITIPNSVTSIGERAFRGCYGLTSITINGSVTSMGSNAFSWCTSLTNATFNGSVTSIGRYAFYACDSLASVTINGSVTSIGDRAFYFCDSLTRIIINGSVTSIGERAFDDCDSLTSIIINGSVTSIGERAFYDCDSLASVTINGSVTSIIGDYAFYSCDSLTSIIINASVTSIGDSAFYNCSKLSVVYFTGTEEEWDKINIGSYNFYLINASIVYNYKTEVAVTAKSLQTFAENGTVEFEYNLKTSDNTNLNGTFYLAAYNKDDMLVGLYSEKVEKTTSEYDISATMTVSETPDRFKAFFWGGESEMEPLSGNS